MWFVHCPHMQPEPLRCAEYVTCKLECVFARLAAALRLWQPVDRHPATLLEQSRAAAEAHFAGKFVQRLTASLESGSQVCFFSRSQCCPGLLPMSLCASHPACCKQAQPMYKTDCTACHCRATNLSYLIIQPGNALLCGSYRNETATILSYDAFGSAYQGATLNYPVCELPSTSEHPELCKCMHLLSSPGGAEPCLAELHAWCRGILSSLQGRYQCIRRSPDLPVPCQHAQAQLICSIRVQIALAPCRREH